MVNEALFLSPFSASQQSYEAETLVVVVVVVVVKEEAVALEKFM